MKNQNIITKLMDMIQEEQPEKTSFIFSDFNSFIKRRYWEPRVRELTDTNYTTWAPGYIADLLKNYATKPKNPKIKREKNKEGLWEYSKNP
jgi:hypothetical protein